ncbi:MAG TPA: hypothetical protein VFO63_16130 [Blastocatellia bacterium]|nr:hypothetical protein [Blastocatellia bacterium]
MKKRTKIVLEIERTLVFKVPKDFQSLWCDGCGKEVRMIRAELAAMLVGTTSSTIQLRIEAGSIHNRQAPTGEALVCIESLQTH